MRYRLRGRALTKPLADLDQRRWLFDNLPIDPTHAEWMRRRAWVRTIQGTARIEGTLRPMSRSRRCPPAKARRGQRQGGPRDHRHPGRTHAC